jgi:S-adenosylmethionine:tRNA ribosyltransferase-isomerase
VAVNVADFDFDLPEDLVAQAPPERRGASRLLVLDRATGTTERTVVSDLPRLLEPGDLLVVNDTRVFPARLLGRRDPSGGAVECLLLGHADEHVRRDDAAARGGQSDDHVAPGPEPARPGAREALWSALVHPGQKLKPGRRFVCEGHGIVLHGEILGMHTFGRRTIRLWTDGAEDVDEAIDRLGHIPLPPYIHRPDTPADRDRYQTVFARSRGSVAAPTAGLHFDEALLEALDARGVERAAITLHVGYGTFKPVRVEQVEDHTVDAEHFEIGDEAAARIDAALAERRRVIAVGTTTTRALESAAIAGDGRVRAGRDVSRLFIYPGFRFQVVGGLITNFHLPRSSLLMLVSAFAGRERVLAAYGEAVAHRFRFYSYGDAMLIT